MFQRELFRVEVVFEKGECKITAKLLSVWCCFQCFHRHVTIRVFVIVPQANLKKKILIIEYLHVNKNLTMVDKTYYVRN